MAAQDEDNTVAGIPWFEPGDWQRLEEVCPDLKKTWESYEQWHSAATRRINELRRHGRRAEKVAVAPEELRAWCDANGLEPTAVACAHFAVEKLREKYG